MTKFYIFRHGETFATKQGVEYGDQVYSAPILEEGKVVIEEMAEFLKNVPTDFNVSSPLLRCTQTCEIITRATGKSFVADKRLIEFYQETVPELEERVKSILKEIKEKKYESVMICTHQNVIVMLLSLLKGKRFEKLNVYEFPAPGILIILDEGEPKEIDFNS